MQPQTNKQWNDFENQSSHLNQQQTNSNQNHNIFDKNAHPFGAPQNHGQFHQMSGASQQQFATPTQPNRAFGNIRNPFAECRTSGLSTMEEEKSTAPPPHRQSNLSHTHQSSLSSSQATPNLKPVKVIGNGAFGYVFEAVCRNTNQRVALKRTQKVGNIVSREYEVLSLLIGAPNVVQLLDFFYTTDSCQRLIQNSVMEFCDCSLEQMLQKAEQNKQLIPMVHIKHFMRQLFNGLQHMHQAKVCHRDLKPENILLKWPQVAINKTSSSEGAGELKKLDPMQADPMQCVLKVADLGSGKVLDESPKRMNTPYVVSRYYRAPELIMGSHFYDFSIDVWAAGCILFELIARTPLFPGESEGMQLLEHSFIRGKPNEDEIRRFSLICEMPVVELMRKNQAIGMKKIDMGSLLSKLSEQGYESEDLQMATDLIEKCLMWVPEDRISAAKAVHHPFLQDQ